METHAGERVAAGGGPMRQDGVAIDLVDEDRGTRGVPPAARASASRSVGDHACPRDCGDSSGPGGACAASGRRRRRPGRGRSRPGTGARSGRCAPRAGARPPAADRRTGSRPGPRRPRRAARRAPGNWRPSSRRPSRRARHRHRGRARSSRPAGDNPPGSPRRSPAPRGRRGDPRARRPADCCRPGRWAAAGATSTTPCTAELARITLPPFSAGQRGSTSERRWRGAPRQSRTGSDCSAPR